jgi:hypothetical protein
VDQGERRRDAHLDRVILVPTAATHPSGTFYMSSYDLVGLQMGYAVSDVAQLTATGTPPLGPDHIFPLDVSLKAAFVRQTWFRVAGAVSATGIVGLDQGNAFVGRVGAVAQLCFEYRCRSSISYGTSLMLAGPAMLDFTGVGAIWRVSDLVALLAEVDMLLPIGQATGQYNGVAPGLGVRFSGPRWGVDVALLGQLPLLVVTYRILP